jgi:hypothetical protein
MAQQQAQPLVILEPAQVHRMTVVQLQVPDKDHKANQAAKR